MTFEELEQIAESTRAEYAKYDHEINVCMGTGCLSQHSDQLKDALAKAVADAADLSGTTVARHSSLRH